jgi:two-component system LytT family response regulator
MIRAIIIDDERHCRKTLSILLHKYCPQVQVVAECSSAGQGLQSIEEQKPDVVFLDVEMPFMNGFEMLGQLPAIHFDIIFTTGYNEYAIKAFRFSALDYLLKPVDKDELQKAVSKINQVSSQDMGQQLQILLQKLENKPIPLQKIALPTLEGFELISLETIVQCESDGNYTLVFLKNGKKFMVSRSLKEMEELLEGHPFLRVHHSHLVNLNEIIRYIRGEGGYLVMSDNTSVNVSRSRKEALLKIFN